MPLQTRGLNVSPDVRAELNQGEALRRAFRRAIRQARRKKRFSDEAALISQAEDKGVDLRAVRSSEERFAGAVARTEARKANLRDMLRQRNSIGRILEDVRTVDAVSQVQQPETLPGPITDIRTRPETGPLPLRQDFDTAPPAVDPGMERGATIPGLSLHQGRQTMNPLRRLVASQPAF